MIDGTMYVISGVGTHESSKVVLILLGGGGGLINTSKTCGPDSK